MTGREKINRPAVIRLATALLFLSAATLVRAYQAPQVAPAAERWYLVRIGGQDVGYVRETTAAKPGGPGGGDIVLVGTSEMTIVLNRLGAKVEMAVRSDFEETRSGLLRRLTFDLKASVLTMRTEVEVKDGLLEVKSGAAGKAFVRTLPFAGELLGPEGVRTRTRDGLRTPGDTVEYRTFEPSLGKIVAAVRVLIGRENLELEGKGVPSLKVEETSDAQPVKRTFWLGEDGKILRDEEPGPFGLTEVVRVDREKALAASAGGELPAEAYERTLLKTGVRLPRPRETEYLKIRLIHRRPELGWPDIPGSNQKVVAKTETTLDLEVRRSAPLRSSPLPLPETAEGRAFLEPNAYLQSDDAELGALAASIVGPEKDAWRAALKLRRWVSDNMTFDLGIAFAPSAEILKNRRGTCVGYATILATLARAAGIPARFVMGYAYALGMFGGHAWTEVLIGGDWIALDAAIPSGGAADAARFQLVSSSLADGAGALAGGAQQVMGYIDVQVLAYRVEGGKTIPVPDGAKPYTINGDAYINPWLGLEVRKPQGFVFGRLDEVWPSTLLVEMKSPDGRRVELHEVPIDPWEKPDEAAWKVMGKMDIEGARRTERTGGRVVYEISGAAKAAYAIPEAGEVWVFIADGRNSTAELVNIVQSFLISPQ